TRTSAPSARSAPANPTIGSTSPRDPYVDNNTRTCRPPFPNSGSSLRLCGMTRVLRQAPHRAIDREWRGLGPLLFCWDDNACRLAAQPSPASQAPPATVVYGRYGGGVPLPPSNGGCVPPAPGAGRR